MVIFRSATLAVTLLAVAGQPAAAQAVLSPAQPSISINYRCDGQTADEAIFASEEVRAVAAAMQAVDLMQSRFAIVYYFSESGSAVRDKDISDRCASSIRRVLIERFGIAPERISATGAVASRVPAGAMASAPENAQLELNNLGPAGR